jgi:hypothetical protein
MNKIYLLPITALLLTGLAGCGSGSSKASSSSSPNAGDKAVKFAQCMRQHGVPMADPTDGQIRIQATGGPQDASKLDAATKACQQYAPQNAAGSQSQQDRDHQLKLAQCLRQKGFNVPDPQPGQGLRITSTGGPVKGNDLNTAMQACQQKVK